jgi:hypothetical protein
VIAPTPEIPMGALIVERIHGRPPRLPHDLPAFAEAMARVHALPVPPADARPRGAGRDRAPGGIHRSSRPGAGRRSGDPRRARLGWGLRPGRGRKRAGPARHPGADRHPSRQLPDRRHRRQRRRRPGDHRRPGKGALRLAGHGSRPRHGLFLDHLGSHGLFLDHLGSGQHGRTQRGRGRGLLSPLPRGTRRGRRRGLGGTARALAHSHAAPLVPAGDHLVRQVVRAAPPAAENTDPATVAHVAGRVADYLSPATLVRMRGEWQCEPSLEALIGAG